MIIILHQVIFHLSLKIQSYHFRKVKPDDKGQKLIDFILQCRWKTKFLGTSSEGLFRTPSERISHCIHLVRTPCSQLPARSGIFCLFVEVVYRSCGLKFVYRTINLFFYWILVKVKFPAKFCWHSIELFYLQISSDSKYFFFLFQGIVIED